MVDVDGLRHHLDVAEAALMAANDGRDRIRVEMMSQREELEQVKGDLKKANLIAKEEEEKRIKAVSLLKTVRQKLVKAEKDRDDAMKENVELKEKVKCLNEKDKEQRLSTELELESMRQEKLREITELKVQFGRELATNRENMERNLSSHSVRFETELLGMTVS